MAGEERQPVSPLAQPRAQTLTGTRANAALALAGIVALVLGVWQIRSSLTLPLGLPKESADTTTELGAVSISDDELRRRDTDQDGLSDYDEQYLYKTSAYLKDTDSDGYDDKTEVVSSNDPLCPSGQVCNAPAPTGTPSAAETGAPNLSAAEIRTLLKQNGVSEAEFAQYDDATLVSIYQQITGEVSPSSSPSSAFKLTPEQQQAIMKLSGSELRQFLIKGGVDAEQLKQFDDATLKALVQETITKP